VKLVFATRNAGKLRELAALVTPLGLEVVSVPLDDVDEDRDSFAGNAEKKARAALTRSGLPALADDSGLEVDALEGAPGVRSARYAGDGHDDAANNRALIAALAGVPPARRTARFRCVLFYADPAGRTLVAEGACEGLIAEAPRGRGGFGYDPLFLVAGDPEGRTMAELPPEEKNRISHRARAMARLVEGLRPLLASGDEIT
jgi:XTP/dITP diphosphohydrolase